MSLPTTLSSALSDMQIPMSMEDLRRYSSADLDPYTLHLGKTLCQKFTFSHHGHRNLVSAFHYLPMSSFKNDQFEVGYGKHHILPVLMESNAGVNLLAIVGVLAEYFKEDFIVDFFMLLVKKADLPTTYRPLEAQWRRVVQVLYGVLTTSTFGTTITALEENIPRPGTGVRIEGLLKALNEMSNLVRDKRRGVKIPVGGELIWLCGLASWLFDLKYVVTSADGETKYLLPGLNSEGEADVVFIQIMAGAEVSEPNSDSSFLPPPEYHYPTEHYVNGGRVGFDQIFRQTFGFRFRGIKDDLLARYLSCVSIMFQKSLSEADTAVSFFLTQPGDLRGAEGRGLDQTMVAWFPELRRLLPRIERYSNLSYDEAKKQFDEVHRMLKEWCECPRCSPSDVLDEGYCAVSIAETVVKFGLYIARMILPPKLYPKKQGVLDLYKRVHTARQTSLEGEHSHKSFEDRVTKQAPSPAEMLKMGMLLFAASISTEAEQQTEVMGVTHAGLCVIVNGGWKDMMEPEAVRNNLLKTVVRVVPGWMCLFGHEARLEIYMSTYHKLSFTEQWEKFRKMDVNVRQMLKWKGQMMLSSVILLNTKEAEQAQADGWTIL